MDWGLKRRMADIVRPPGGRAVMLAVDHGYFLGPTERLENPARAVRPLVQHCDSLMLTRGVLRACVNPNSRVPVVLRVSGGPSIIGEDLSDEQITVGIRDALRLGASALAMSVFVGARHERQTVVNLGRLVDEAEEYGVPVLAVTAVGKDMARDARYLSLACRMAAEQGARIVKTYYCEGFEKVVESCPVPVIIAGGKKIGERGALELTANAVAAGAVGVDMGRNIWQSDHPVAMIRAVRSIVHEKRTAAEAHSLYGQLARQEGGRGGGGAGAQAGRPQKGGTGSRPQGQRQGRPQQRGGSQAQGRPQGQGQQQGRPQGQGQQQGRPQGQGQQQGRPQGQGQQSGAQKDRMQSSQGGGQKDQASENGQKDQPGQGGGQKDQASENGQKDQPGQGGGQKDQASENGQKGGSEAAPADAGRAAGQEQGAGESQGRNDGAGGAGNAGGNGEGSPQP